MSIYVGGEKAKLYRGDYCPAQFYKGDVKIAGYTDAEKVGAQISGVETYNDALNLTIEGRSEQTVTANSPSPDHPEPIRSSENFDVVSCGRNLFDEERILPIQGWIKQGDGSFFVPNNSTPYTKVLWENTDGYTGQIAVDIQHRRRDAGSLYTGAFPSIEYTDGSRSIPSNFSGVEWVTSTFISDRAKAVKQITWTYGTGNIGTYVKDLLIAKSNTITPYEPYHATTAHITEPLRSVGDVADSIEVSDGKAEVVRRCGEIKLTSREIIRKYVNGCYIVAHQMATIYPKRLPCTHCLGLDKTDVLYFHANIFGEIVSSVQIFAAWLDEQVSKGTPVLVEYVSTDTTRTDITTTPLGQALLAMRAYPHYTQVYTNATLPPTLRAHIKEMEP